MKIKMVHGRLPGETGDPSGVFTGVPFRVFRGQTSSLLSSFASPCTFFQYTGVEKVFFPFFSSGYALASVKRAGRGGEGASRFRMSVRELPSSFAW